MADFDFKMRADTPRVVRSPFTPSHTAYVMDGTLFEDERSRLVLGVVPSPDLEAELIAALDEADNRRRILDAVTTIEKIVGAGVIVQETTTDG